MILKQLQGVRTLRAKSNLLILPSKSWSIHDSLGSNQPQDVHNLYTGCTIDFCTNVLFQINITLEKSKEIHPLKTVSLQNFEKKGIIIYN